MYRQQSLSTHDHTGMIGVLIVIASVTVFTATISAYSTTPWVTGASPSPLAATAPLGQQFKSETPLTEAPDIDEATLRNKLNLLHRGMSFLKARGSYSATMTKQESVGGELLPEQTITLKCRQIPFSVYLLWHSGDKGREVLYIEGANQGKLIGHDGGWKARIPAVSVKPDSSLAMRDSRYPVTKAGIGGLVEIMTEVHEHDLQGKTFASCVSRSHISFGGRDCEEFTTVYKDASTSPTYRKSVTLIDSEWHVPLASRHYEWPKSGSSSASEQLDAETLIESYEFTQIDFQQQFTDADFDRDNEEYAFR